MKIIDEHLINGVIEEARRSPRLRMNYNFHQSLDDKCHRFLNALEMGTDIPIHHHVTKDETFILLKGRVRVSTYDDNGEVIQTVVLSHDEGRIGVDIPKNTWHTVECLEPDSVIFEVKEGPFVTHEKDGILERLNEESTDNNDKRTE
jgi:cupin fold WbuC family metalloprotein